MLGLHYMMPWPNRELLSARPLRRSPLYDRLAAQNALFGSKMGWERPNFFAPTRADARIDYSWDRQNWFPYAAAEHKATREAVTITDLTSFSKFLLQGRDAEARAAAALRQRCRGAGRQYGLYRPAQCARDLRERSDRRAPCAVRFLLVTGTAQSTRDADWIGRIPAGRGRDAHRRHVGLCGDCRDGPARARPAGARDQGAARQCGVSVRRDPRDRYRARQLAGVTPHLRGRTRLGALRRRPNMPARSTTR